MGKLWGVIVLMFSLASVAMATTEYGVENPVTRQCMMVEEGHLFQPLLFWSPVGEQGSQNLEVYAASKGYSVTQFPYRVELMLLAGVILGVGIWLVCQRRSFTVMT